MGLDIYFYEIDEQDYKRNDDDGTITVLSSNSLRQLSYYRKWYDLSDFIYEIWYTDTRGYLDYDEYNNAYVLLVRSDIDSLEEFARDYEDIELRTRLLVTIGILKAAINNGKHILYNNDW